MERTIPAISAAALALFLSLGPNLVLAQRKNPVDGYPSKPVRLIIANEGQGAGGHQPQAFPGRP